MRNKGFFWSITIALALACVYQLSFTWATSGVEADADDYAQEKLDSLLNPAFNVDYVVLDRDTLVPSDSKDSGIIINFYVDEYLRDVANEKVYMGYTYAECQKNEINLGLDLQGGMSVTLEISIPELVSKLAGDTRNPAFRAAMTAAGTRTDAGEGAFIEMFVEEWESANKDTPLAKIFYIRNQDNLKSDATNAEVASFLNEQANGALDGVEVIIEKRVNTFGVAQPTIQKLPGTNRIFVELPGVKDRASVRRKLQQTANLEFYEVYDPSTSNIGELVFSANFENTLKKALYGDEEIEEVKDTTVSDSTSLINELLGDEDGIDAMLGDENPETAEVSEDEVLDSATIANMSIAEKKKEFPIQMVLFPNIRMNPETQQQMWGTGALGYSAVKDTSEVMSKLNHPSVQDQLPEDVRFMWDAKEAEDQETGIPIGIIYLYAIKVPSTGAKVDGNDIDDSYHRASQKMNGSYEVILNMTTTGAEKWEEMTTANIGRPVAVTMDDYVFTAPTINEALSTTCVITGDFDLYESRDLSGLLNAGALPAPVNIVDETVVGPSLGASNVTSGLWSFVFALCLVLCYMVFYYSKAGLIADLALVINVFFLIGALASMKAILTLPGIAGIVLTIGMSVDANVLIFERIREELRHGKGTKAAVKDGYQKALAAILDANITTLLTGIVLATFGTGPIKGFATTLIIGIFTSFFAAVIITRLIVSSFLDKDKNVSFSTKMTENWFTKTAVPFVRKRKLFYVISGAIVLLGIGSLMTRSLDFGVDFTGGRQFVVNFKDAPADNDKIRENLTVVFEGQAPTVKMVEDTYTSMITTKYNVNSSGEDANTLVETKLQEGLVEFGENEIISTNMIAPTISKDLKTNSLYAIGFSLLIIFLYILFRFRKWQFGLGALIAMAHDVIVVLALFSLFWGILPFSMEIDQAFIAAILTVVGYSINDTVVVFDRIREYLKIHTKKDQKEVINMALNSTLSRTVNTSVSTFIVLLIIFIFGGDAIKGFTFALMIGVVVGTYSSLFIATPAVIDFSKKAGPKEVE